MEWRLTKVNGKWQMSSFKRYGIEHRDLRWYEWAYYWIRGKL